MGGTQLTTPPHSPRFIVLSSMSRAAQAYCAIRSYFDDEVFADKIVICSVAIR